MSTVSIQTATLANVTSAATSVTVFSANGAARARAVYNDSTAVLYLKFGTTASTTSYTVQIAAGGYYEFPLPLYGGRVDGIWASANGAARTTEW
jgi:hypothetical protein